MHEKSLFGLKIMDFQLFNSRFVCSQARNQEYFREGEFSWN